MKVEHVYLLMANECDRKYLLVVGKGLKLVNHATFPITTNEAVGTSFTAI